LKYQRQRQIDTTSDQEKNRNSIINLVVSKKKEAWLKNLDYHKSLPMPFEEYGRRGREPDDIVYNQSGN